MSDRDVEDRDGPPDGEAQPEDTILPAQESADAETEFSPFELDDEFKPVPVYATQADGLPGNVVPETHSDIPPLSRETLICMGDFSKFVIRDEWEALATLNGKPDGKPLTFEPEEVDRAPNGKWRVTRRAAFGDRELEGEWVEVQPIRPPCKHYVRQTSQYGLNAAHRKIYRLCAARRTTEGTFMTVSDVAVYACSMREPRHGDSEEKYLDRFDAMKIEQGKEREMVDMFDRTLRPDNQGAGGILAGPGK